MPQSSQWRSVFRSAEKFLPLLLSQSCRALCASPMAPTSTRTELLDWQPGQRDGYEKKNKRFIFPFEMHPRTVREK
jgi:hypothetical protein